MGIVPTTIQDISAVGFADRMAALYPPGWASPEAKSPGGAFYALLSMLGGGLSFESGALTYALDATRIQTATDGALDLASVDYLGDRASRLPGETDPSYRLRILAALLPAGATRKAVSDAVQAVTGFVPRIVEPWRPADTGGWDQFYWDVDTPETPFRWTDSDMGYQGFIECVLPQPLFLGGNPAPCLDANFWWDVAGSSFIDPDPSTPLGPQVVYDAINLAKVEGTVVWVQFVTPAAFRWDQPGVTWDQPGVNWA